MNVLCVTFKLRVQHFPSKAVNDDSISCFRFSGQNVWFGFFNQECSDISSLQGELIKSECVAIT